MSAVELSADQLNTLCSEMLGARAVSAALIGGGGNSRVYRLTCADGAHYAVKAYFRHPGDQRDRLAVEFGALQFLWENGVRCVPRPLVSNNQQGLAVYEYVDGVRPAAAEVDAAHIDSLAAFLAQLDALKTQPSARQLPAAAEACFSLTAVIDNLQSRLDRVTALPHSPDPYEALHEFLSGSLAPAFREITQWSRIGFDHMGVSADIELPVEGRTLSPSDFGFHNTLRRPDGRLVFLDLEYFGWDDPAKMIADFLLHPAMEVATVLRKRFCDTVLTSFAANKTLAKRVEYVYPLFGLKWCFIMLNEFVPKDLLRRGFATGQVSDKVGLQLAQLEKARRMLEKIKREYERFPYKN